MKLSSAPVLITCLLLLATVLVAPKWEKQFTEAPISWDVSGYYLYLPALFIHNDIKKLNFLPEVIEKYKPSHAPDQAFPVENGNMVMKYPAGMAILYSPFFFIAHGVANYSDFPADGFSLPYQVAIQLGGLCVGIFGLFILWKILRRFFSNQISSWTILLIGIGTNFFNYATFDSGNVHVWSFTLLALLVHLTILWHDRPTVLRAIGIGGCIGLAALVRPTEIIIALIPIAWGFQNWKQKTALLKKHSTQLFAAVVVTAAIGFIQLFYWKSVSGNWIVYSYQNQGFSFANPHFANVFFSYRKGWLIYTPLMFFAMLGMVNMVKKWRVSSAPYTIPVIVFFIVNTWIVASWDIWWYGGAFGQRAMIPSYVLLAFPLAGLLTWVKGQNRFWVRAIFVFLFTMCTSLNLFQTYQAHWGPWEASAMNKAYFWKIFLNPKIDMNDKLLLDTNELFAGKKARRQLLYENDFENYDTTSLSKKFSFSGSNSYTVFGEEKTAKKIQIERPGNMAHPQWLNFQAKCFSPDFIPQAWKMPVVAVRFMDGENISEQYIFRPHRVLQWWKEWRDISADLPIPEKDFDHIEVFIWNQQGVGGQLYVDDLKIEVFEKE